MKFNQTSGGANVGIQYQKEIAGISGSTREDVVTAITKVGDNKFCIGGYTNTNTSNPYDAFLIVFNENLIIQQRERSLVPILLKSNRY